MKSSKINRLIVLLIALLVILASILGLFVPDFYANRNNAITTFEIAGQDIVSLVSGVLLLWLTLASQKGKIFRVVVAGLLVYTAYTYAYFSFGLIVSKIYMIYLAIAGLSLYSIVSILVGLKDEDVGGVDRRRKIISAYVIVVVALVGIIDCQDLVMKTILSTDGMNTWGAFYVLDVAFLFPAMAIAAFKSIEGHIPAVFFTGAFLIKTIALMPALILADILHFANRGVFVDLSFDVIAVVVMMSAIFFFYLYQQDMQRT